MGFKNMNGFDWKLFLAKMIFVSILSMASTTSLEKKSLSAFKSLDDMDVLAALIMVSVPRESTFTLIF